MVDEPTQAGGVLDPQRALAFLAEASAVLARSLDYERTLAEVAQLSVPEFADWCGVDVVQADGSLRQITSGHPDPRIEEFLLELRRRYREEKGTSQGAMHVIATGESELETDVRGAPQIEIASNEESGLYEALAARSYMIVPMVARGRTIGALTFLSTRDGLHYGPVDLGFAQHLASRFAMAADNARLYQDAEIARERLTYLARASELMAETLDLEETLQQVAYLVVPRLADWCAIELLAEDGSIQNAATAHIDPDKVKFAEEIRTRWPVDPDDPTGLPNVIRTGKPELYPEIPDELLEQSIEDPEQLEMARELGLSSILIVPLIARARTLGALTLVHAESGRIATTRRTCASPRISPAERPWRWTTRASTRRSTTPWSRSRRACCRASCRTCRACSSRRATCRPPRSSTWAATGTTRSRWRDGSVGLAIGDVVGHGIEAAAVMGQFRNAPARLRARRRGPAALRWNASTGSPARSSSTTWPRSSTASSTPAPNRMRFVRAGHPPPLLLAADGGVTAINGQGGLPVGVSPNTPTTADARRSPPDSTLLLYTDGLVERRGESLDDGIQRLERVLCRRAGRPGGALRPRDPGLGARSRPRRRHRDPRRCARVEVDAAVFHTSLRAEPGELSRLRRMLMRWLRATKASAQEIYDITIAYGEACANAIEHAYGARPATLRGGGRLGGRGRDRCASATTATGARRAGQHRGRGLKLIEALMEDVEIAARRPRYGGTDEQAAIGSED